MFNSILTSIPAYIWAIFIIVLQFHFFKLYLQADFIFAQHIKIVATTYTNVIITNSQSVIVGSGIL